MRHKYNAVKTKLDGITFDSKAEARRYEALKQLKQDGEIVQFLRQIPFYLPGGVRYVCDFQIFWADGRVTFEDVKGMVTTLFTAKKKMVEDLYAPITIDIVK